MRPDQDITNGVFEQSGRLREPALMEQPPPGAPLSRHEFVDRLQASRRTLWCIAAAVLGGRAQADDVLQEAAVIALAKLDQFNPATSFTAWMGQIVRFVALNESRRQKRHGAVDVESTDLPAIELKPDSHAVSGRGQLLAGQHLFDDHVVGALNTLSDTARACLLLRTVLDMPYNEIAAALDIPEGTAMSHVHRARHAMRRQLTTSHQPGQPSGPGRRA